MVDRAWIDRFRGFCHFHLYKVWTPIVGERPQSTRSGLPLIAEALKIAKRAEAYPFDAALSLSASSTGYVTTFKRAGFKIVARRIPAHPIVRHDLKTIA